jgi:hypothetical protein
MSTAQPIEPSYQKPLRLWPGVVIVAIQWLLRFVLPVFVPEALGIGVIGGLVCGFLVVVVVAVLQPGGLVGTAGCFGPDSRRDGRHVAPR